MARLTTPTAAVRAPINIAGASAFRSKALRTLPMTYLRYDWLGRRSQTKGSGRSLIWLIPKPDFIHKLTVRTQRVTARPRVRPLFLVDIFDVTEDFETPESSVTGHRVMRREELLNATFFASFSKMQDRASVNTGLFESLNIT